jgi:hypothetical protein
MKVAVMTCKMADGRLKSVPNVSVAPLIEAAREIRKTCMLEDEPVASVNVMTSWHLLPVMDFNCSKVAEVPPMAGKKSKK